MTSAGGLKELAPPLDPRLLRRGGALQSDATGNDDLLGVPSLTGSRILSILTRPMRRDLMTTTFYVDGTLEAFLDDQMTTPSLTVMRTCSASASAGCSGMVPTRW